MNVSSSPMEDASMLIGPTLKDAMEVRLCGFLQVASDEAAGGWALG